MESYDNELILSLPIKMSAVGYHVKLMYMFLAVH